LSQNAVLSHAKAPPNQVLGSVNEMAQPWEEALLSDMVLLDSNAMSTLQKEALLAINNNSITENELTRVNALKKHPYNYHMKQRPSSGLIWNQSSRKNILSHNQVICLVQHALDHLDAPLFVTSLETIKLSNGQF